MSAIERGTRIRPRPLALGAAIAGLAVAPAGAAAQQPAPRGWLGVNMTQHYECVWETNTDWKSCDLVMSVEAVESGGPASTAGIRPGDKLVALNGQELTYESSGRLIGSIRPGAPVSVDFMRDGVRRYVHVTPVARPERPDAVAWTGRPPESRPSVFVRRDAPRAFVITLSDPDESGGETFAITIRETAGTEDVTVEPAALRVVDGQLRLVELDASSDLLQTSAFRDRFLVDLRQIQDSTYRKATDALQVMASIRQRLSQEDFRRRVARVAQAGLDELQLGARLFNSFAGAELEVASGALATAVDADREGLLVIRVVSGTPAERLGLRAGDVLFEAEGRPVRSLLDLRRVIDGHDGTIEVKWIRKGVEHAGRLPGQ